MPDINANSDAFSRQLSNLRHDLRTPVGHVIGYSEMIEEDLDQDGLKAHAHDLQAIQNAGQRILALIEDFLGAAKGTPDEIDFDEAQYQMRLQLNHIGGYTEMLREDAVEDGNEDLIADLDKISSAEKNIVSKLEQLGPKFFDSEKQKATTLKNEIGKSNQEPVKKSTEVLLGSGGEILIVDDDAANRELLKRRLARSGYTSTSVESGEEALELLKSQRFDLIMLDLMMPGISGLETLEQIQTSARLRTIPVIMISAADDVDMMVQCILHGAEDYISKPFNPVLLTARINACLEKVRLRQNISRQFQIFISSPGDVIPERRVLKRVIGGLNEEFSGRAYLIPILWEEEPLLASDTFQAQIHPPRETDIYIGILWSRIGSPLPETILRDDGSRYDSGTAFEFEDALSGFKANGSPDMLLYRKSGAPTLSLSDPSIVVDRLEQIELLKAYIDRWLIAEDGSYIGAFHMFSEIEEFEVMSEMHLRKLVERLLSD
jgi:DNA-binding response OmpR family regulator